MITAAFTLLILLIACTAVAYVLWGITKRLPQRSKVRKDQGIQPFTSTH